ncbi:GNAT family N-acetyltransferase [Pseudomonas avellanae]|uniref:GNAT family N-acetyltransferase n=1 Tax=Pseudomonas avellanae TaxID=46257 RepID=UPI00028EAFCE|nr:GNAT family N-acetyltransferase [Pseudomonas avellanae]EKG33958.1 putative acetyltransferase [Pseudomonas avellanae BPIC 631]UQW68040.1 GNAT family N-acetyltransferase [Pseudomonas avellanae]UQW73947.1 GNAT family N-acetyltransferase [Pseudomonas avellanae]GGJ20974.1 N-acetyltransferase GCN5 [Pseudomonas avellanae]
MKFDLRLSQDNDLSDLIRLSAQARVRYKIIPSLAHVADSPALSEERFNVCRVMVAVDRDSQRVIGFAAMRPLDGLLYLDTIAVDPEASGNGVGEGLLLSVMAHAHAQQVKAVSLTTFREPLWNGPWFRKHGFSLMPQAHVGAGLRAVIDRQSLTHRPATRETLWRLL